jgi:hypothetical protein
MARHPAPQGTSHKVLSRRILVNVKRDMTAVIPRVIWQHEKPLLEELFGEGNVIEVDAAVLDEGYSGTPRPDMLAYNKTMDKVPKPSTTMGIGHVFIGDPGGEFERLATVYGKHQEENVLLVEKIYGRFQGGAFARLMGEPELADLPVTQLRGLVLDYGYAPEPHKDASEAEKKEAWERRKALATMDHAGLVKVAEEVGVQIG